MSSRFLHGGNVFANGIRQHYLRYGGNEGEYSTQPAIVLIPGITSPAITWGFVGEVLGTRFDTYVLDVRGRGLSSDSDTLDYSLDAQADDVVRSSTRWACPRSASSAIRSVRASRPAPPRVSLRG